MLNKNDIIEIDIDGIGYNGEGIAHVGGYTVFIRYALPGEKVRALIILAKPTFAVGKLQTVLRPSPDRAEPFCPVYYKCGGCSLQHMTYDAQLRFKRQSVRETFFKAAHLQAEPDAVVPSGKIKEYRNKMSLPVRGEIPQLGFFAEGTHRLVPIRECPIQFSGNGELIRAFSDYLIQNRISGYNETTGEGVVRHISVRTIGGIITVAAVTNGNHIKKLAPFEKTLKDLYGNNYRYYVNINTARGNKILGDKSEFVGGTTEPAEVDGLKLHIHPQSFFQVNDEVRRKLYDAVTKEVHSAAVIDAYSGAGVLSCIIAENAKHVSAIEIEPKAVESAQSLLELNGINNIKLVCGDCAEVLGNELDAVTKSYGTPVVVLDPPRAGCDKPTLNAVANGKIKKIVYVSCNPATLARDAAYLTENGYTLTRLTPFDMFPHSANVETLCVLENRNRSITG